MNKFIRMVSCGITRKGKDSQKKVSSFEVYSTAEELNSWEVSKLGKSRVELRQ